VTRFLALLGGSELMVVDLWGGRQLAYKIGPRESGYYVVARFGVDPKVLPEFERALRLDDGIVRYLITLHEHEVGAPNLSYEDLVAGRRRDDDDDDED
jgi:small subunit ribosomal protein S6